MLHSFVDVARCFVRMLRYDDVILKLTRAINVHVYVRGQFKEYLNWQEFDRGPAFADVDTE